LQRKLFCPSTAEKQQLCPQGQSLLYFGFNVRWLNEKTWRKPKASTTEVDADILTLPFAA